MSGKIKENSVVFSEMNGKSETGKRLMAYAEGVSERMKAVPDGKKRERSGNGKI